MSNSFLLLFFFKVYIGKRCKRCKPVNQNIKFMDYYNTARRIFFNAGIGQEFSFGIDEGIKVRANLYVIVNRNPNIHKIFKSRKKDGVIRIWRKM